MVEQDTVGQAQMRLESVPLVRGRALSIGATGSLYISRGYSIFRSSDGGREWHLDCRVPAAGWQPLAAQSALAARLLRFNIQALQVLPDGARVAVARDGIYRAEPGEPEMRRTWAVERGSRPINLSAEGTRLLFGEYGGAEMDRVRVRIYCSEDGGRHFDVVHELPKGDVHHIHNVVVDAYAGHYWVLAGDHGRTPGIAALSRDCRHLDWVERGDQMVRAVNLLVRPDCLIYGSDSEVEPNYIVRLDKRSGRYQRIAALNGSSLYAADFGQLGAISTCVEPSRVNRGRQAGVYTSVDGENWFEPFFAKKDRWHAALFQLGLIVLPYVQSRDPKHGMFSGQAVVHHHDRINLFRLGG